MNRAAVAKRNKLEFEILIHHTLTNREWMIERFNRNLVVVPHPKLNTPCRLWQGSRDRSGYCRMNFRYGKRHVRLAVHRAFLIMKLCRPIDVDMEAGHDCHTPNCVSHVREVTRNANLKARDARQKEHENCPF